MVVAVDLAHAPETSLSRLSLQKGMFDPDRYIFQIELCLKLRRASTKLCKRAGRGRAPVP